MAATPPCPQALHDKLRRELREILTLLAAAPAPASAATTAGAAAAAATGAAHHQAAKLLRDYQHFARLLEATAVPGSAHVRWVRK
jgi:hypothetical protein